MGREEGNIQNHESEKQKRRKRRGFTFLKVFAIVVCCLLLLVIGAIIWAELYFTPERIARIISEEASKNLKADVTVGQVEYTLFSTYPWVKIEADNINVVSRTLPKAERYPEDYSDLFSAGSLKASINLRKLISGEIELEDVSLSDLKANIVIVNDSINNFSIFPEMKKEMKMPDIKAGKIEIIDPVVINFTDLSKDIYLKGTLENFNLKGNKKGDYNLSFDVTGAGKVSGLTYTESLRANVEGDISANIDEFQLKTKGLKITLDPIETLIDLDFKATNGKYRIEDFKLSAHISDIFKLPAILPEEIKKNISLPKELTGKIPLSVAIKTERPYDLPHSFNFSVNNMDFSQLPALTTAVSIDGGYMQYGVGNNLTKADDITLLLTADFNPDSPYDTHLDLRHLHLVSEHIDINLKGALEEALTENPAVKGSLTCSTSLAEALAGIPLPKGLAASGEVGLSTDFSFDLKDFINNPQLSNLVVEGNLKTDNIKISYSPQSVKANLKDTELSFDFSLPQAVNLNSLQKGNLVFGFNSKETGVTAKDLNLSLRNVIFNFEGNAATTSANQSFGGDMGLKITDLNMKQGSTVLSLSGLNTNVSGGLLKSPNSFNSSLSTVPSCIDDSIVASRVQKTPMWLSPSAPGVLAAIMTMADLNLDLDINAGRFVTPLYDAVNMFSDISIKTDLNDIDINSLQAKIGDTSLKLKGKVEGLGAFLNAGAPSMLKTALDIDFDNVDINSLAGAYYAAVEKTTGKPYDFSIPPQGPYTAADSVCVVIPRNITAEVNLKSKSAEYMGFRFSPLSTKITLKNGVAALNDLTVGTPYTTLDVTWIYSTASLADIFMSFKGSVNDFNFDRFFSVFPQLADKAPEIRNLSGALNIDFDAKFDMFPSMFMNSPSLEARFTTRGMNLTFDRSGKIEKITHLMMIKGDAPIKISGLDINGFFRNNLLLIEPFHLEFDNYRIGFAGVNNLQGQMYYHLALEKSPFHLPFGVNLVGNFSDPEIRLGGTEVKSGREREISSDLRGNINANIMTTLQRGWRMFIEEAGKYYLRKEEK